MHRPRGTPFSLHLFRTLGVRTKHNSGGGGGNNGRGLVHVRQLNFSATRSGSTGGGGHGGPMPWRAAGVGGNAAAMSTPAHQHACGSNRRNDSGHAGRRALSAGTGGHRQAPAAAYENIESEDEVEEINEDLGSFGRPMVSSYHMHV